jgi:hypothetical protein
MSDACQRSAVVNHHWFYHKWCNLNCMSFSKQSTTQQPLLTGVIRVGERTTVMQMSLTAIANWEEGSRLLCQPIGTKAMMMMVMVKVKLSLWLTKHHAMKTCWGNGGIAPRILDLGIRWTWVVSFTPRPFYPQGKSPEYPLDRRLGGPQSRSGHGGEEKNSQPPPWIEP